MEPTGGWLLSFILTRLFSDSTAPFLCSCLFYESRLAFARGLALWEHQASLLVSGSVGVHGTVCLEGVRLCIQLHLEPHATRNGLRRRRNEADRPRWR
jgi:hypothetical protein